MLKSLYSKMLAWLLLNLLLAGGRRVRFLRAVQQHLWARARLAVQLQRGKRVPGAQHRAAIPLHAGMECHRQGLRQAGPAIPSGQPRRSVAVLRRGFRPPRHPRNGPAHPAHALHPLPRSLQGLQGQRGLPDRNRSRPHPSGHLRPAGEPDGVLVRPDPLCPRRQP